jgi:hypothetical protein
MRIAKDERHTLRPVLVSGAIAVVVTAFLAIVVDRSGSSASATDGARFGAFDRAARADDVLPANVSRAVAKSTEAIIPATARLTTSDTDGFRLYVARSTSGDMCTITVDDYGYGWGCSSATDFQAARSPVGTSSSQKERACTACWPTAPETRH